MANANTTAAVRAAKNPQEALLAIAAALDRIEARTPEPLAWGGDWTSAPEQPPAWLRPSRAGIDPAFQVIEDEHAGTTDIVFTAPSSERLAARRQFATQQLKLGEMLNDDSQDWAEVYAKGGPLWLYHGNRELVMSYPDHIRQALVADVLLDDPTAAHEMGRDILKQPTDATGPGQSIAVADGYYPHGVSR